MHLSAISYLGRRAGHFHRIHALAASSNAGNHVVVGSAGQAFIRVTGRARGGDQRIGTAAGSRTLHVVTARARTGVPTQGHLPGSGLGSNSRRRRNRNWRGSGRRGGPARHSILEAANPFAQTLHHFGNPPPAKENQHHGQHNQPMKNTKFTHEFTSTSPLALRLVRKMAWKGVCSGRIPVWSSF